LLAKSSHRAVTVVLAVLAVGGQIVHVRALIAAATGSGPLAGSARPSLIAVVGAGAIVSVTAALTAVVVSVRGRDDRGAQPIALSLAAWAYLLAYSGLMLLLAPRGGGWPRAVFDAHFVCVEALGLAGLLRFTAAFPVALAPSDLQDPASLPPGLRGAQRVRIALLAPPGPWIAAATAVAVLLVFNRSLGRGVAEAALLPLADVFRFLALGVVVFNLRRGYLLARGAARARAQWVALGFVLLLAAAGVVIGANVLIGVTGWESTRINWRPVLLDVGVLGLLWGLSRGVLYEGDASAVRLVPRVGLLAMAATAGLLLAAGLESFFAGALPGRLHLPEGVGSVLAVTAVATLYTKGRVTLESALSRSWRGAGSPRPDS